MLIAVDKKSLKAVKNDDNEYIYLFDKETLKDLKKLNMHCIHYKHCGLVDINLTDYDIDYIKKAKMTDNNYDKIERKDYKIGIIIPNYNYEHTIEKCLNSILNQTYKNFEIIFVDDMSTDNSVDIAEKTYQKYLYDTYGKYDDTNLIEKMNVIKLKQKRLNGGARNEGYLHLSDDVDYIWYVDSDDWLYDETVLERINEKLQGQPDVLFVGLASYKNGVTNPNCLIPNYKDSYDAIQGWSGSSGKVIKKELATRQECLYNEGTLKEDRNQHCRVCIYMKSFKQLKEPVYVWNQSNYKSVTTIREKTIWGTSTIRHWADTLQLYLSEKGKNLKIDNYLKERVERAKSEVFSGGDRQW